jgi:hypothetical protein
MWWAMCFWPPISWSHWLSRRKRRVFYTKLPLKHLSNAQSSTKPWIQHLFCLWVVLLPKIVISGHFGIFPFNGRVVD